MLRLFYASGTSAMAPHILLTDAGLDFETEKVNLDRKTWRGGDYNQINPKSYVPTLQISPTKYLTECAVILEFIALKAKSDYRSSEESMAYWQERMWLNYIATELHKNFISPFRRGNWLPNTADSKKLVWQRVVPRLQYVEERLQGPWLMGKRFSMADPYLFVMTNWMRRLGFSFDGLQKLQAFDESMRERPSVKEVLRVEGRPHSVTDG
ncbi:glutathione S-transferase family protein [Lacticaseibacillus parahuelsenbergensis]|uniref:Glutathione S-transferase family protein n=1 Tax=Lacticaseibacillus parahuelsenbergensis TaxID=3068305 RepID=A0ABY9L6I3_9LACO|nr:MULTISPECIES: glutathione S-transferase family protein [Lacticaseibacillus]MDE3282209.1 glutathione S-transferase family protein [Lacticaseibacillus casei]WLV79098.1 glutathione S-transferase family protein [Lacticaseibacillus sp. NCIMB 15471]